MCLSHHAIALTWFQKKSGSEKPPDARVASDATRAKFEHIRCPLCGWRPQKSSRWVCADCAQPENFRGGCGTTWNTFDTGGVCPGCGHQWQWTMCLQCQTWSPHNAWYAHQLK